MRQNLVKVCTKESPNLISNLIPPISLQYTFQLNKIFYILSCSTRACTFDIIFLHFKYTYFQTTASSLGGRKTKNCHQRSRILEYEAIVVEVTMSRPIINNLMTVFIPTILLLAISFTSRVFAEDYIDMVIMVNLTILLVLATM